MFSCVHTIVNCVLVWCKCRCVAREGKYAHPKRKQCCVIRKTRHTPARSGSPLAGLLVQIAACSATTAVAAHRLMVQATPPSTVRLLIFSNPRPVAQGKFAEAEPLCKRSLAIQEMALGPEHPALAALLNNSAGRSKRQASTACSSTLLLRFYHPLLHGAYFGLIPVVWYLSKVTFCSSRFDFLANCRQTCISVEDIIAHIDHRFVSGKQRCGIEGDPKDN